ncbi:MAG: AzlC family ABC transporter permease [Pseudomonadota bacterium]
MLAVTFFGMLFGATAINNGLGFWQTLGSSAAVFAGASQFVFLELYNQQVPVWSILLAVFAVNFRHVLYSASISRFIRHFNAFQTYSSFFFLSDPAFAASDQRANTVGLSFSYYLGFAASLYPLWLASTALGAGMGNLITNPSALGMDMLLGLYFLSLLIGFRGRPNWLTVVLASGVSSTLIYNWIGSPWHITFGAVIGIILATLMPIRERIQPVVNEQLAEEGAVRD